ncbi:hotdog fold thioesterase [Cytophagaceae bacterium ABcell3]|nr:hotdog fold thioesterase [Cytophagaceae bacterium ABcell3]
MINTKISISELNKSVQNTLISYIGIEITNLTEQKVQGKMPVDARTHQPMGLLHGGASVSLAETLGSIGSSLCIDLEKQYPVGLEINANHVKSMSSGYVYGEATLIHFGKKTHIWDIRITNEKEELVCVSRLTVAILDKK